MAPTSTAPALDHGDDAMSASSAAPIAPFPSTPTTSGRLPAASMHNAASTGSAKGKSRRADKDVLATKRRCVSTACIACRRRKSKCDGNLPSCAACASVYGTDCIYDPNSDHRRKGVYKQDIDTLKTRNSTLQTLIQGILNAPEADVAELVRKIRTCESLEEVADDLTANEAAIEGTASDADEASSFARANGTGGPNGRPDSFSGHDRGAADDGPRFARELVGKLGELRLEDGAVRFLGGTSNLLFRDAEDRVHDSHDEAPSEGLYAQQEDAIRSWTTVTDDVELIVHLLNMYFTWHYTYFATLSKSLFFKAFFRGRRHQSAVSAASPSANDAGSLPRPSEHCASILVNAMLALGCHFTAQPAACANPADPTTAGDHFFREAKRLLVDNDELERPRLATVQALALMSVREAGCGREATGWIYSGMSFRMASDLGLDIETATRRLDDQEVDARRMTLWGCFLFDKCWSNYLGRMPQLPLNNLTTPKFEVFPREDAELWSPWTDHGLEDNHTQPSRTRAIARQISTLCEISNDLIMTFYRPSTDRPLTRQAEVKKLSDVHTRLEAWRKQLPRELEPREGQLPNALVMHMFFQLLYIHLFRPFLKYAPPKSPLPPHVSPRKICTAAATQISKLLRQYQRAYGLRQICNIVVYIVHAACTIHLLNISDRTRFDALSTKDAAPSQAAGVAETKTAEPPSATLAMPNERTARRDFSHGIRQLDLIAAGWPCARRAITTLGLQVRRWGIVLPEDIATVLAQAESRSRASLPSRASADDARLVAEAHAVAWEASPSIEQVHHFARHGFFGLGSSTSPPSLHRNGPVQAASDEAITPASAMPELSRGETTVTTRSNSANGSPAAPPQSGIQASIHMPAGNKTASPIHASFPQSQGDSRISMRATLPQSSNNAGGAGSVSVPPAGASPGSAKHPTINHKVSASGNSGDAMSLAGARSRTAAHIALPQSNLQAFDRMQHPPLPSTSSVGLGSAALGPANSSAQAKPLDTQHFAPSPVSFPMAEMDSLSWPTSELTSSAHAAPSPFPTNVPQAPGSLANMTPLHSTGEPYTAGMAPQYQPTPTQHMSADTSSAMPAAPNANMAELDTLFDESKDWWLRDQSQIFDNWAHAAAFASARRLSNGSGVSSAGGSGTGNAAGNGMGIGTFHPGGLAFLDYSNTSMEEAATGFEGGPLG